ncbi:family 43 glycosylhydrolase [Modestobacter muralis]|uniref:Family 43 glycosylhydrolase n=1 Tax=Modestobacter muralis TaxID=1608614 RepID=A0A6P0EUR5_9ACTN|nr:family 43 glycosylhydrolase [Modestobacter muralis]NEN51531.1 family 43 glycosylhydrolase [Modestobacter muralis]
MSSPTSFRRLAAGGAFLVLTLCAPALAGTASAAPGQPGTPPPGAGSTSMIEPVIDANFADPDVLLVDGVYHAYATNNDGQNVQHQTSTDLVNWTPQPDAAPTLGAWVGECSFAPGGATDNCVWAPEVTAVAGGYALYYTARDATSPRQCIGVSTSASPDGPFVPVGTEPLVCPNGENGTTDLGGAIDAATYSENGQLYLLWKADGNCCAGKTAIIFIQPLSADGTTLTGDPVELIRRDLPWEGNVVEAPTLVKKDGTYYLFYSSNDFGGGGYRTGYATSTSITGPYTKSTTELVTSEMFQDHVLGYGGQDVVTNPDGGTSIIFHGWDPTYSYRAMYVSDLNWTDGVPVVEEAAVRYQAEDGVLANARVVGDPAASGLEKVGGLDDTNSSVTITVQAEKSGPATLGIRYTNGSIDGGVPVTATDTLTVNGRSAGTVTFAHTTWGNWRMVETQVQLKKGTNTITLTKATFFAEIDAFDVYDASHVPDPKGPPAGPTTTRYEAEQGTVTHARVVGDGSASGGAKVGGMDFADSSVSLQVYAERGGPATLAIRFANGSDRGGYPVESTDTVTVNGQAAGTVTFPYTRWENWTTIEHQVQLEKGWNTVTLTRGTFYAEIDAVDVS